MLKLNTVNGKFDIVFAGELLNGGKKSWDVPQTNLFTRYRNTELKSQVLPKEQLQKAKPKKKIPIRHNEIQKIKHVLPTDKKPAKKTLAKNIGNTSQRKHAAKITSKKKIDEKEQPTIQKNIVTKEEPSDTANLYKSDKNIPLNLSGNMFKKNTFVLENSNIMNSQNVGVISREDLNHMFQGFFEDSNTFKPVEPITLPDTSAQDFRFNPNVDHDLTYKQEEYNPWGRPGCGAPVKDKNENVLADSYSSAPNFQINNRKNIIRNEESNYVEEYNPWGRPGCGAPLKDKDENIVADLKSYKSSNNRSQSYPGHTQKRASREHKGQSSFTENDTSPQQPNLSFSGSSTFARGKGRPQIELQETEKRRIKELEHQAAIKLQVEEKRRLKRLDKDRELKEEKEAEIRYRKEEERLRETTEKEKRKQQEQEERMKRHQEMLQESIKKANIEAKRVKESMKQESSKNRNSGSTKDNRLEEKQSQVKRRLHNDEDAIVPSNKFNTNENVPNILIGSQTFGSSALIKEDIFENQRFSWDSERANETFTQSEPNFVSSFESKYTKEIDTRNNDVKSNRFALNNENNNTLRHRSHGKEFSTDTSDMSSEKDLINDIRNRGRRSIERSDIKLNLEPVDKSPLENIFNDFMIPFHRTQTTDLIGDLKPILTSEVKTCVKDVPDIFPDTERCTSPDVISARQQQILKQLHALRQGLMQKEREYILEKNA